MDQYQLLDVTRPFISPLFNYKRSVKFIIHGYVENGNSGKIVTSFKRSKIISLYYKLFQSEKKDFHRQLECNYRKISVDM